MKAITRTDALAFALVTAAVVAPASAMARSAYPCSGQASYVDGHYVVNNMTPAGGADSQCEILVEPSGLRVQNGGDRQNPDGVDATHESQGHAP